MPPRGGGWVLSMDALERSHEIRDQLRQRGGYCVTHAISLSRADDAPFTSAEATDALHAVRCALVLALGRRADIVLPVGWRTREPVWARWTAGRVDSYQDHGSWLDARVAATQVAEAVGRFLDCWPDPLRRDTLLYATSYYSQALALGVELGTAAAVSGLSLLGYSWLVEDRHAYSASEWGNLGNTEAQIRALLEFSECRINTAVPDGFADLQNVAHRLDAAKAPSDAMRDGLGCVIALRNHVMHPTRSRRTRWSAYQWAEAHILATHFLELALLAYVGYRERYHPRISANRWPGYLQDVPWAGC